MLGFYVVEVVIICQMSRRRVTFLYICQCPLEYKLKTVDVVLELVCVCNIITGDLWVLRPLD